LLPLELGSAGKVLSGPGAPEVAESAEEREPGVASVSAAVRDRHGVVAAVSISGPIERLTRSPGQRYGAAVRLTAELLSGLLVT
jgi:DNA-binding IclR family transcriptional regulator